MKLESRLGDFLRSLFKVTGIPQATTEFVNKQKFRFLRVSSHQQIANNQVGIAGEGGAVGGGG